MKGVYVTLGLLVLFSTLSAIDCKENKLAEDLDLYPTDTADSSVEFEHEEESSNDIQLPTGSQSVDGFGVCDCNRVSCGCCQEKKYSFFWLIKVKLLACIRITALPNRNEARLVYALNHRHVFNQKISLNALPRVCKSVPRFVKYLSKSTICLEFTHVNTAARSMCARVTGYIKITGKTRHVYAVLGCFRLPVIRSDLDPEITANTFRDYLSVENMEHVPEEESQSEM